MGAKKASLPDDFVSSGTSTYYRVKEIFPTVQGEGFWSGTPSVFVRLTGCNQWSGYEEDRERDAKKHGSDCPLWCDTDFTKEGSSRYSAETLLAQVISKGVSVRHVVFTGGEPLLQLDGELMDVFHDMDYYVHVETNGTINLESRFGSRSGHRLDSSWPDWVTCSPKLPLHRLELEWIDELKLIMPDYHPRDYNDLIDRVDFKEFEGLARRYLYVQPEDGPRYSEAVQACIDWVLKHPSWKISAQSHKQLDLA